MFGFTPVEQQPRGIRDTDPRSGHLWSCMYLASFVIFYGLSFVMPFCTDGSVATNTTLETDNGVRLRSFSEVWRFSWEYVGLAARCLTLAMLLVGSVVGVCRACCDHTRTPLPCVSPDLCGVVAGITGLYAEMVLLVEVCLLSLNQTLIQSQVFCSVTSALCFFIGLFIYRSKASSNEPTTPPQSVRHLGPPVCDLVEQSGHVNSHDLHDRRSNSGGSPSTRPTCSVVTATEEGLMHGAGQRRFHGDGHFSDSSQDDQQIQKRSGAFATGVGSNPCSPEDLPDGLTRLAEELRREDLPDRPKRQSKGCFCEDVLGDLKSLLPAQGDACGGDDTIAGGDFDHRAQYIDDDLFYHSSDDDHLEAFIRPESSLQEQPSEASVESRTTMSASSTTQLIQTEQALLLLFGDSDEFYRLSDEEDSYKNKTWP